MENNILQCFWCVFLNDFKNTIFIKNKNANCKNTKYIEIKKIIEKELNNIKKEFIKIDFQNLKIENYYYINILNDILFYLIYKHPYFSSKFEDILKIKKNFQTIIKSEILIGNDILKDEIIKNNLITNRNELISLITKHKYLSKVGIELTKKHIEAAVFLNRFYEKEKKFSINISEEEILDENFYFFLSQIKRNIKKNLNKNIKNIIQLELLEYDIDFSQKEVWDKLKRLKELEIDLSIDDFGSAYSNLKRITQIRDSHKKENLEYIKTIKIDAKLTSSIAIEEYIKEIKYKCLEKDSKDYINFIYHISNIIDIPFLNIKIIFEELNKNHNIYDLLKKINYIYKKNVIKEAKKYERTYIELLSYIEKNKLAKKINLVFEYIDNDIIKKIILKLDNELEIDILFQGYYFKESQKPLYFSEFKEYIYDFLI